MKYYCFFNHMYQNNEIPVSVTPHRNKDGQILPYTLDLGRQIKQRLWERMNRPLITAWSNEDKLTSVVMSYGVGVYPPLHEVDTAGEPEPGKPSRKRAKN